MMFLLINDLCPLFESINKKFLYNLRCICETLGFPPPPAGQNGRPLQDGGAYKLHFLNFRVDLTPLILDIYISYPLNSRLSYIDFYSKFISCVNSYVDLTLKLCLVSTLLVFQQYLLFTEQLLHAACTVQPYIGPCFSHLWLYKILLFSAAHVLAPLS